MANENGRPEDEEVSGGIRIRVAVQNLNIVLEFTQPVTHVYMSPGEVSMLCKNLLEAQIKVVSQTPKIIVPNG